MEARPAIVNIIGLHAQRFHEQLTRGLDDDGLEELTLPRPVRSTHKRAGPAAAAKP